MHKNLFVRIFPHHLQESRKGLVMRERTVPRDRNVSHPQPVDLFPLGLGAVATVVHHDVDAILGQGLETLMCGLPSAKQRGRNFAKIADALDSPLYSMRAAVGNGRVARSLLFLAPIHGDG